MIADPYLVDMVGDLNASTGALVCNYGLSALINHQRSSLHGPRVEPEPSCGLVGFKVASRKAAHRAGLPTTLALPQAGDDFGDERDVRVCRCPRSTCPQRGGRFLGALWHRHRAIGLARGWRANRLPDRLGKIPRAQLRFPPLMLYSRPQKVRRGRAEHARGSLMRSLNCNDPRSPAPAVTRMNLSVFPYPLKPCVAGVQHLSGQARRPRVPVGSRDRAWLEHCVMTNAACQYGLAGSKSSKSAPITNSNSGGIRDNRRPDEAPRSFRL